MSDDKEIHVGAESGPESDVENDEIIGVAFRRSMQLLALMLLVGVAGYVVWRLVMAGGEVAETTIEAAAPVQAAASQGASGPPPLPFTDITLEAGIEFVHENGAAGAPAERFEAERAGNSVMSAEAPYAMPEISRMRNHGTRKATSVPSVNSGSVSRL